MHCMQTRGRYALYIIIMYAKANNNNNNNKSHVFICVFKSVNAVINSGYERPVMLFTVSFCYLFSHISQLVK